MSDDVQVFPLFPLPLVVFPGDIVPLHIFETKYKAMMADCLVGEPGADSLPFVICLYHEDALQETGTTVQVVQVVNTFEDGRMDILVQGLERVRVEKSYPA